MGVAIHFDVVIIGAGCAGLAVASSLPKTYRVAIISKSPDINSDYAQGGISAVSTSVDSFDAHIRDTLAAGSYLNDKSVVEKIVQLGPKVIQTLEAIGMPMTRKMDQRLDLNQEGGHRHPRIVHHLDITGQTLMKTLWLAAKKNERQVVFSHHAVIDLFPQPGAHTLGVVDVKNNQYFQLNTNHVVIATGGYSGIYQNHTGAGNAIGEGAYLALKAGLSLVNMEFVQFHPTCFYETSPQALITEALRGKGAHICLENGERFLFDYDPKGEMAPRDITASGIYQTMQTHHLKHVWLDATHLSSKFLMNAFPQVYQMCLSRGLKIDQQKIPITPCAHYTCGGVETNYAGETTIEGVYAIGEVCHSGFHGANRLASNSLLECLAMGHWCGQLIEKKSMPCETVCFESVDQQPFSAHRGDENAHKCVEMIAKNMWKKVGITRTPQGIEQMLELLDEVRKQFFIKPQNQATNYATAVLYNNWLVAKSVATSALCRTHSIGCHHLVGKPPTKVVKQNTVLHLNQLL